jgi:hypothetical protein
VSDSFRRHRGEQRGATAALTKLERRLPHATPLGGFMANTTAHDDSFAHILVIERGCRWPKRSGERAAHTRIDVVVQRRSEDPDAFARRVLTAVRHRSGRIASVVLIGNAAWDEHALGARSAIVRGVVQLASECQPEIVLCTDASADERAFRAMGAFAATFRELVASAACVRSLRHPPMRPTRASEDFARAA